MQGGNGHSQKGCKEASKLGPQDRVELISSLLEDLDPSPHHVSDEEAIQRLQDLKSGKVAERRGISREGCTPIRPLKG